MTIKKKIWISNILMVLIPVFITGAVIAVSIHTSLGAYWHSLESMYQDENRMQSAMSLIYTYLPAGTMGYELGGTVYAFCRGSGTERPDVSPGAAAF